MNPGWRPGASSATLRARAELLAAIRQFFAHRGVLEVETPLVSNAASTDVHLHSIVAGGERYLHTSPEFAMKRLLAAGSGPIYQVCKVFRAGEAGCRHNPEFSMLEWYRPGFTLDELMAEVCDLLDALLGGLSWQRSCYRELFLRHLSLDPHRASDDEIARSGEQVAGGLLPDMSRPDWLDLLMSRAVEPKLGGGGVMVTDFPACQAALSVVERDELGDPVARRFEVYADGLELGNGYLELLDTDELRRRQQHDLARRREKGLPQLPADHNLLAAMDHGLPACSGVALGLDRLLMCQLGVDDIRQVLTFNWDNA